MHPNIRRIVLQMTVLKAKHLRAALHFHKKERFCRAHGDRLHATTASLGKIGCIVAYRAAHNVWYAARNGHHIPLNDVHRAMGA